MNFFISTIAILCTSVSVFSEEIRLLDLEPTDAQQYIDKQDTTLKYAPKIESNVPAVRYLGKEPHNVLEDIYLANQYHGQDGLGGYLYGYSVPDIAKTEKKKAGGDLKGAYNYITGDGQEIKVEYWDDGTGFHQVDNVPKILPKQIEDTPEVKAARDEHFRIWQEQAERNSRPVESPYNSQGQYAQGPLSVQGQQQQQQQQQYRQPQHQLQGQAQQLVNQYQQQKQQYPIPGQPVQYRGEQGQQTQQVNRYQQPGGQYSGGQQGGSGQGSAQFTGSHQGAQSSAGFQTSGQFGGGQASGGYKVSGNPQPAGQYSGGQQGGAGQGSAQFTGIHQGAQSSAGYQTGGQFGGGQASGGYKVGGNPQPSGQYSGGQQQGQYGSQQGGQYGSQQGGQYGSQQGGQYGSGYQSGSHGGQDEGQWKEEQQEEQGPPKGFFYSFDYPVGIIVQKDGGPAVQKRDVKEVYAVNKANFEQQLQRGQLEARPARSASGYLFIKE